MPPRFAGSCALSVQANRHTPFANRRMKFYARTITETQRPFQYSHVDRLAIARSPTAVSRPKYSGKLDIERVDIPSTCVSHKHLRAVGSGIAPPPQGPLELTQTLQAKEVLGMRITEPYTSNLGITIPADVLYVLNMAAVGGPG